MALNCTWRLSSYREVNTLSLGYEIDQLALYREVWILFVCPDSHKEHKNTLCGKDVYYKGGSAWNNQ